MLKYARLSHEIKSCLQLSNTQCITVESLCSHYSTIMLLNQMVNISSISKRNLNKHLIICTCINNIYGTLTDTQKDIFFEKAEDIISMFNSLF